MRFDIPSKVALACALISGCSVSANNHKNNDDYHTSSVHSISHKSASLISGNFTCNEPFMIPAEYVDPAGHPFAMCFSDPRFNRKQVIWYIQSMRDGYKALGIAQGSSFGSTRKSFVGSVIPIEHPAEGTGMHADPVQVVVNLDQAAGVITVRPRKGHGSLVNWIIRPNGFPPGTLEVPNSCGPFLETLKDPELIAPLTGASGRAQVCIAREKRGDAFISWGPTDSSTNFFTLGFIGHDRGIAIDICDPGNVEAGRCEMTSLIGNNRKTFIVGADGQQDPDDDQHFDEEFDEKLAKKHKEHKDKKSDKKHKKAKKSAKKHKKHHDKKNELKHKAHQVEHKIHEKTKHKKHHHSKHEDTSENNDNSELIQKIDLIESNLERLIMNHEKKLAPSDSDDENVVSKKKKKTSKSHHRHPKPIKKHKEKKCHGVKHPLLYPPSTDDEPSNHKHRPSTEDDSEFNLLYQRLRRLESRIHQSESIMLRRLAAFNHWLARQMRGVQAQTRKFKRFLAQLQADVVYTPKTSKKKKMIEFVGSTFRGIENGLGSTEKGAGGAVGNVTGSTVDTLSNVASEPLGTVGNAIDGTLDSAGNTLSGTVNTAGNALNSGVNVVGSTAGDALNGTVDVVGNTVGNVIGDTPTTSNRNPNYFDFNDDLPGPRMIWLSRRESKASLKIRSGRSVRF